MSKPTTPITLRVAECAALFDQKVPGWAAKVPLGSVDVSDVARSPLAYIIGPNWDERITSASAMEMGAFTLYTAEAEAANRAWQRQISTRRVRHRQAS